MDRTSIIRIMIGVAGALLGSWMAVGGLELRLFGSYFNWHQQIQFLRYPESLFQLEYLTIDDLTILGWPMVVVGASWGGALIGFWNGERWSVPAMILLSALALPFPLPGSTLGIVLLLSIFTTRAIRNIGDNPSDAN